MTKQLGRAFLVKIWDSTLTTPAYVPFGGMTAKSLSINGERIDATTPDPTTPAGKQWRETLDGTRSIDVSGDITLVGDGAEARAVAVAMADDNTEKFEVIVPGIGTFDGTYSMNIEFSGDGAATASISLASTGAVTFTPAA